MRIVVISDTHIPERASKIPNVILKFAQQADIVVHAGDFTSKSVYESLKSYGKLVAVSGNMDFIALPEKEVFKAKNVKFGVFHGHGVYPRGDFEKLTKIGEEMDVDVLLTGHTHSPAVHKGDLVIVNPGSATGAWGGGGGSGFPSFAVISVEDVLNLQIYEIRETLKVRTFKIEVYLAACRRSVIESLRSL